jgi:hypothetical protein
MYPVAVVLQYTIQYNIQKTQNNTYTLKTIHNTKITNTITENYKHNAHKIIVCFQDVSGLPVTCGVQFSFSEQPCLYCI